MDLDAPAPFKVVLLNLLDAHANLQHALANHLPLPVEERRSVALDKALDRFEESLRYHFRPREET